MVTAEIVSYAILFCVSFTFSILALSQLMQVRRVSIDWLTPVLEGVSSVCWFILAPLHLAFVGVASVFLSAPAILWFAFGVIFLLFAIRSVLENMRNAVLSAGRVDTVE